MRALLAGAAVSFLNFGIHAGMTAVIVAATRHTAKRTGHLGIFWRLTALLTITMTVLMFAHIAEIAVWAAYLDFAGIAIKGTDPFEFAFENYTALGYGDALPADAPYRIIGPVMALNGLLLIGWSIAVIFEVMRMAEFRFGRSDKQAG
jgi:hypothetical protein